MTILFNGIAVSQKENFTGDDLAARQDRDVFEHCLAATANARCLNSSDIQRAAVSGSARNERIDAAYQGLLVNPVAAGQRFVFSALFENFFPVSDNPRATTGMVRMTRQFPYRFRILDILDQGFEFP